MTESRNPRDPYGRTRTRGAFAPKYAFYRSHSVPGGSYHSMFPSGTKVDTFDIVTPGFKKMQASGRVLMNHYSNSIRVKSSVAMSLGNGYFGSDPNKYWRYEAGPDTSWSLGWGFASTGIEYQPLIIQGPDLDNAKVEASTACLSAIGRASTNTWENLAEANKTMNMAWHPLSSWYSFERNARAKTAAMSMANAWLAYRYGIKPLISSMNDIMKALGKMKSTDRETTRGFSSTHLQSVNTSTYYNYGAFPIRDAIQESAIVRAMSLDEITKDFSHAVGFGSKDLLTLPWELVRYSFVVDWFLNVGDYLGALAETFYRRNLGRCLVTTIVTDRQRQNTAHYANGAGYVVSNPVLSLARETLTSKWRDIGLRSPGIVIKNDFRLDNATRLADAVALVGQQLLRRFGGWKQP